MPAQNEAKKLSGLVVKTAYEREADGRSYTIVEMHGGRKLVVPTSDVEIQNEQSGEWPEHEKAAPIIPFSQKVGEFMQWLMHEKNVSLTRHFPEGDNGEPKEVVDESEASHVMFGGPRVYENPDYESWPEHSIPVHSMLDLLHEYFGIDKQKLAEEKTKMVERIGGGPE